MMSDSFAECAVRRVTCLLQPSAKAELKALRLSGPGTNRVFRIPIGQSSGGFVILKLLPSWRSELRRLWKARTRNLLYGEHYVELVGRARATAEIARYREWRAEGLPVPALIETPIPYVRIIEGLPFPTFRDILVATDVPTERKLEAVDSGIQAMAAQHRLAIERGKASLVHPDAQPNNLFYDAGTGATYWFDLEHPDSYPRMGVGDVAVRALRIFLYGILYRLPAQVDAILQLLIDRYEPGRLLWVLADNIEAGANRLPLRLAESIRFKESPPVSRSGLAVRLRELLGEQGPEWRGQSG